MKAMESSNNFPLEGNVDVDEFFVGGQETGKRGRGKKDKNLVIIAIEKKKRGISRIYSKVTEKTDSDSLGDFMKQTVDFQANIKADGWHGYSPLKKDFEHLQQILAGEKGGNFPEIHSAIMLFKS